MRPCGRQEDTTLVNAVFGMPRGGQVKKVVRGDFFFFTCFKTFEDNRQRLKLDF